MITSYCRSDIILQIVYIFIKHISGLLSLVGINILITQKLLIRNLRHFDLDSQTFSIKSTPK